MELPLILKDENCLLPCLDSVEIHIKKLIELAQEWYKLYEWCEEEYLRETYYRADGIKSKDVLIEQEKIQNSDAIVFIYPVFWTEAPAKLVGWFDRIWTTGFAYNPNPTMKVLEKALFIVCAGNQWNLSLKQGKRVLWKQ